MAALLSSTPARWIVPTMQCVVATRQSVVMRQAAVQMAFSILQPLRPKFSTMGTWSRAVQYLRGLVQVAPLSVRRRCGALVSVGLVVVDDVLLCVVVGVYVCLSHVRRAPLPPPDPCLLCSCADGCAAVSRAGGACDDGGVVAGCARTAGSADHVVTSGDTLVCGADGVEDGIQV